MSYAPGSESAHMFHLSHFHRLVSFCWFGLVVGGVCLCFFAFLLTTDQPVRSSYQPMTIIAYLHDCHCRYDERSNDQKKKRASSVHGMSKKKNQGVLLPVELLQRHPLLFLRKVSKPTTHPDIGATQGFQAAFCLRRTLPFIVSQ